MKKVFSYFHQEQFYPIKVYLYYLLKILLFYPVATLTIFLIRYYNILF